MNEHYQKWDELAPRGLILIGLGVSLTGQGIIAKANKKGIVAWFFWGTLGLLVLNAGISIFGEAIKERALYELEVQKLRETV